MSTDSLKMDTRHPYFFGDPVLALRDNTLRDHNACSLFMCQVGYYLISLASSNLQGLSQSHPLKGTLRGLRALLKNFNLAFIGCFQNCRNQYHDQTIKRSCLSLLKDTMRYEKNLRKKSCVSDHTWAHIAVPTSTFKRPLTTFMLESLQAVYSIDNIQG